MLKAVLLGFALGFMSPVVAYAADGKATPQQVVSETINQIEASNPAEIADIIVSRIDTAAIARFTLGRYGRALSEVDQVRFETSFREFLHRQISSNVDVFLGVEVEVIDTQLRSQRDAIVTTRIFNAQAEPLLVRWRVLKRNGDWGIVDLEYAGMWLAIEQRAQVSAILGRPGASIEDVIAKFG